FQWLGIVTVMVFFYIFSLAGRNEGVDFKRNKWIFAIVGATILGSISGMYDKYLMLHHHHVAVQAWFSIYMVVVFLPFLLFIWYPKRKITTRFEWRWVVPLIGVTLTVADYLYFWALSDSDSLIGVVSVLRRSSVVISFVLGAIIFKEGNIKRKALALFGILAGIVLILIGT
ncbi:MAG: DMT family transporter, partial [Bacteroidales bacterium]|nr:DMT family transporter [Bacteroidales bacterium]